MTAVSIQSIQQRAVAQSLSMVAARSFHQLDEHGDAWNRLSEISNHCTPMSSYSWTRSHLEHFLAPDTNWLVLFAYEGRNLVAVLPLVLERGLRNFGMTVARSIHGDHTICADMISSPGSEAECIWFFLANIHGELPGLVDIEFPFIIDDSPTYAFANGIVSGYKPLVRQWGACGWLATEGDFAHYMSTLDRELKKNLRRMSTRLHESGRVTVSIADSIESDTSHFQRFIRLEHSGWKGNRGTSICSSGLTQNFYRVLTSRLRELGWLEWHFLEIDGKDIAAQLAVRTGSTLYLIKTAYDENYRRFAPGKLLFEQSLKRAFSLPTVTRVNCLGFGELYKPWNMQTNRFVEVHFVRTGFAGMVLKKLPLQLRSAHRGNADAQLAQRDTGV